MKFITATGKLDAKKEFSLSGKRTDLLKQPCLYALYKHEHNPRVRHKR